MNKAERKTDHQPLISVVILNWNGTDDTIHCLKSAFNVDYDNYEIIVVDNGSVESIHPLEELAEAGKITLLKNPKNMGFAGGQTTALPYCNGEYILLLNNDAIMEKSAIKEALKVFDGDTQIAVVGGRTYLLDDNWNKQGIFHYTHQRVDPVSAEVHTYTSDDDTVRDASTVSGACVFIRKSVIKKHGYFDDAFFAYYEETDLFARYRRAGYRIVFSPNVIIWHKMGASTRNKKFMYHYLMFRNQYYFAYKNFDKDYLKLFKSNNRRHFRRSLLVYLRRLGRLKKHDVVYKARVHAYLKTVLMRPRLMRKRRSTLAINPGFSLNDTYFTDNPLPISILIDATKITKAQTSTLCKNLSLVNSLATRPEEIVVVSKYPISMPKTESLVRFANIIDRETDTLTPYDFYFMTSNCNALLFGKAIFLDKVLSIDQLKTIEDQLRRIYTTIESRETVALLAGPSRVVTPAYLKHEDYEILALSKLTLVNHMSDHHDINTITTDVITDTVGRSVAQCVDVRTSASSEFFGIPRGEASLKYEPILSSTTRWWMKYLLTKLHVWSITAKLLRATGIIKIQHAKPDHGRVDTIPPDIKSLPIFFNTRDRYEPLINMVSWLEKNGYTNIVFIDNQSTYPPLVKYFSESKHQVIDLGRNAMHKAPWESLAVRFFAKTSHYIVSDPDIVFDEHCPDNVITYLASLLNKYPEVNKAGVGLRIDNLPDGNHQKNDIISWERRFWDKSILLEKNVYKADVDTTFALYRPNTWWFLSPSIRTGGRYVALHEPWYQLSSDPTDDFMYYKMRASREVSTWGMDALPKHHMRALKKEGYIDQLDDEEEDD